MVPPPDQTPPLTDFSSQQAGSADAALHQQASLPTPASAEPTVAGGLGYPSLLTEDLEDAPFWKEVVAFAHFSPSELEPHQGKFIAVYQGSIVDSDADEAELALRFYRVFGYVPVYIHAVGLEDDVIDVIE